jgi:glycosyltransferase involved in cell wall biosynthesis
MHMLRNRIWSIADATVTVRQHVAVQAARPHSPRPARPIRVCFLIDQLTTAGTETQLLALIHNLNRSRVEPFLCLLRGEDAASRALEPDNCPVLRLGVGSLRHPATFIKAWRLAQFLRRERIDVLELYFLDSTYVGVPVGRLAGVPYILRTRHNIGHWMTPGHRRLGGFLNRFVTATIANCEACRQAVLADEGAPAASVVVLENGVDLARYLDIPVGDTPRRPDHPRRVGAVANLRPVKGLDVLLEAISAVSASYPDIELQIAGEGELRPALEDRAKELGLSGRFTLLGSIADIPAFLSQLDAAVLSSRAEGMSNAILEYMAAGRAIVATAVGGTLRLIDDGVHGLLVPPGDARQLAQAIERLLRDRDLAVRLGTAARRRAQERYSREAMVRRFENFYGGLVGGQIGVR